MNIVNGYYNNNNKKPSEFPQVGFGNGRMYAAESLSSIDLNIVNG